MKNTKTDKLSLLLIGIGNCGRNDDGLGWHFVDVLNRIGPENISLEYRYQLQVEDAQLISNYDVVLFADATHDVLPQGFDFRPCLPVNHYYFSSHAQSPGTVLYLADELFQCKPEAYTIAITGYNWGLGTIISKQAAANLESSCYAFLNVFLPALQKGYTASGQAVS